MERIDNKTELENKYAHINGWGIDADPENDPTYPMKERKEDVDNMGYKWERPPQQPVNVEVLRSIERPNVSAVYGSSTPPGGLSGAIRRFAFKYSESTYKHWVPLVLADRVNVVEGIIDDLKKGIVPNIFAEKGWKWEWQNNRKALITKVATTVAVTTLVVALLMRRKRLAD